MSFASFVTRGIAGVALAAALGSATATHAQDRPAFRAEQAAIATLRQANNQAIAQRDLDGVMLIVADDYVAVGGGDSILRSKADIRKFWAREFAAPHPGSQCVRRPTTIEVGQEGGVLRAAETGRWRCPRQTRSGAAVPYGAYFAHWSKRSGVWRLVSDNYVTLGCRGPGCSSVGGR